MKEKEQRLVDSRQIIRVCSLVMAFIFITLGVFLWLRESYIKQYQSYEPNMTQQVLFTLGGGVLVATIAVLWLKACMYTEKKERGVWACPLAAAGLGLAIMSLAYVFLGVWPVGDKSILMVDMHHQYAPLLSELRDMFINGGSFTYSFHIGLGANFIACFSYYLASPLNILLIFFSEQSLAEGILLITLIKNACAAGAFAACAQYIYRKRSAAVVATAVMYSMMLYMLAYSWNIMWLDAVALLPIVVMCFERMQRERKWLGYVLTLALALFSNYYIGFMLCVFLVLYFIVWQVRKERTLRERAIGTGLFAAGSLLGGGLAAAILIPTALALSRTSAAGDAFPEFAVNMSVFDLLGRFFYGATPTIRSGNLPNLYCGVAAVLLAPIYATQRSIPLRRRVSFVALLAVLLFSCTIKQWDIVWHGLHSPNDLPYRFSFLVGFVMLLMAASVLSQLTRITSKQILGSLTAGAVYLILWEQFGGENKIDSRLLYINLALLAVYAVVLLVGASRRIPARAGRLLLLAVVTLELIFGSSATLIQMDKKEYFTQQANYVDNDATAATAAAVERAQQIAEEAGDEFCRIEYLPRSTCMDTALHHYNGITTFASSNPYYTTLFMGDLGYAINGVNSYLYHSFVPAVDSLMGIKYVIFQNSVGNHDQLKLVDTVEVGTERRYIYENTAALPLGVFASMDIADYQGTDYAPFSNQQMLYTAILGKHAELYTRLDLTADGNSSIYGSSFIKNDDMTESLFTGNVTESGRYYAFVDCRAATAIRVETLFEDGSVINSWSVTTYEPYVIDLGTLQEGKGVQVSISSDGTVSGNIHVVKLNETAMNSAIDTLSKRGLTVTEHSSTRITGTVNAPENGALYLSIPYDSGWTAYVDGKKAETFPVDKAETVDDEEKIDGALLAVKLPAGEHTVELKYTAPGQVLGIIATLVCAAVIAALWWLERRREKRAAVVSAPTEPPKSDKEKK
ncbi:MAG: YfhO family protein [Clostridia bacterium]|nr:YfhO family protein [Clostridia bacterium]